MAPQADWTEPELPRRARSEVIAAWLNDHPNNYAGLARLAGQLISDQKWKEALQPLEKMRQLYADDEGATSPYAMLAQVYRELGDAPQERAALEKLATLSDDDIEMFARLTELASQANDWPAARKHALRWLAVSPLQPAPHRALAAAAEQENDEALAIDSYRALLLLDPFDPAELHLKLATALQQAGDLPAAKRHALLALEETPRYRAAHQRLLAIISQINQNGQEEKANPSQPATLPP
jgi:tetratricopeptide (TPR) repeat protein